MPHCTQADSVKRRRGSSGVSSSAPVGQAEVQAMQSVQASRSMATRP